MGFRWVRGICRFFGFVGEPRGAAVLIDALVKAAEMDHLKPGGGGHGDGWGYALYADGAILHGRSGRAIYSEKGRARRVAGMWSGRGALLMHARRAGRNEPLGLLAAHPFAGVLRGGDVVFLAHNGSVDKRVLAHTLGLEPLLGEYPDTYFLLKSVERYSDPIDGLRDTYSLLQRHGGLGEASNVIMLRIGVNGEATVLAYPHHPRDDRALYAYYRMYVAESVWGRGFVSSSLLKHIPGEWSFMELEPDRAYVARV